MSLELCPRCGHLSVEHDSHYGRKRCLMQSPYCGWRGDIPPTQVQRLSSLEARISKLEGAAREEGT